jgi:hypothetical protein
VISSSQKPLPANTHNIHYRQTAPLRFEHTDSKGERLRPHGQWDWLRTCNYVITAVYFLTHWPCDLASTNCTLSSCKRHFGRSQWPRGLSRRSAAARLLRSWVRNSPGAWIFFRCVCCVLSGRGLLDEMITRPENSYWLWCVVVCDLETSWVRRPWLTGGCRAKKQTKESSRTLWRFLLHQHVSFGCFLSRCKQCINQKKFKFSSSSSIVRYRSTYWNKFLFLCKPFLTRHWWSCAIYWKSFGDMFSITYFTKTLQINKLYAKQNIFHAPWYVVYHTQHSIRRPFTFLQK